MDSEYDIKPSDAFQVANQFLGWGEARGGIWFVGLEEASDWKPTSEDIKSFRGIEVDSLRDPSDDSKYPGEKLKTGIQIRAYICKIVQPLSRSFSESNWRMYREQKFWRPGCGLLQINLYPLGKPHRGDWPEHFQSTFGFGASDRERYESHVHTTRFKRIAELWAQSEKPPVVVFGMEGWNPCRTIFELGEGQLMDGGKMEAHQTQRVILAPFFSYWHMSNTRAQLVSDKLKEWGVAIP